MTNTADMTPVEIDTELSRIYEEQARLWQAIVLKVQELERYEKRMSNPMVSDQEVSRLRDLMNTASDELKALHTENTETISESAPYQVAYNSRPWNRYFLVKNVNGHVHRGMDCSTCFRDTQYSWLVELADCDEDAMIEEWGELACTVCFPSAPTNPLYNRPSRRDREAQEARATEKAAKQAEKDAKAITDVDGSPLRIDGHLIKTKIAARNEMSNLFQNAVYYGKQEDRIRKLAPALDAARVEWHKVAERAIKKAIKESAVPPHNPFRLTPEQIAQAEVEIKANAKAAQALLTEYRGW
jgi:hypothetical protein